MVLWAIDPYSNKILLDYEDISNPGTQTISLLINFTSSAF